MELYSYPLSKKFEISEASQTLLTLNFEDKDPLKLCWKFVAVAYRSGLVVGMILGHEFRNKKHNWFSKTIS